MVSSGEVFATRNIYRFAKWNAMKDMNRWVVQNDNVLSILSTILWNGQGFRCSAQVSKH